MDKHINEFAHPAPYPEVKVLRPNQYYANLLTDDYAGLVSEFTAINQYLFHHFYFEKVDEYLGKLLEGVAITEMHHMEMLADAIILLGGVPLFRGSYSTDGAFWNGSFVKYGTTLCNRLAEDIKAEKMAIKTYREHIMLIDDPYIQALLERIILDEQLHLKLFREAMEKYNCK